MPADKQRMVTFAYAAYLGFFVCMSFNLFASLMALCVIGSGDSRLPGFLMACVYWFAGMPGAWFLWSAPADLLSPPPNAPACHMSWSLQAARLLPAHRVQAPWLCMQCGRWMATPARNAAPWPGLSQSCGCAGTAVCTTPAGTTGR